MTRTGRRHTAVVYHPSSLWVTEEGKKAWSRLFHGSITYKEAGITHDDFYYLGFLIDRTYIPLDSVREKYGTEGERAFLKLLEIDYAVRKEAYTT